MELLRMPSRKFRCSLKIKCDEGTSFRDCVTYSAKPNDNSDGEESESENGITNDLFVMLRNGNADSFIAAINDQNEINLDDHDGSYTYLQYASDNRMKEVVEALLNRGANPNRTGPNSLLTPLMLAGYKGYFDIVNVFAKYESTCYYAVKNDLKENVLHTVIRGMNDFSMYIDKNRNHFRCLELILDFTLNDVAKSGLDINCGDVSGNTPLHYAARLGYSNVVLLLLRHGAYIWKKNLLEHPAIKFISPKVLKNYLDECLLENKKRPLEDSYEIIFTYNFLVPAREEIKCACCSSQVNVDVRDSSNTDASQTDDCVFETEPLVYMSRLPDFRPLLKHPILTGFIHLKWQKIKKFFYLNFIFYVLFWALLTVYILRYHETQNDTSNDNSFNDSRVNGTLDNEPDQKSLSELVRSLVIVFFIVFIVREIFQFAIAPLKYVCDPENWLEMALTFVTISILFGNSTAHQQISAVAILLSWLEFVLLIGRFPAISANIEMFKVVSWNFLKFLSFYSILIIAFALSLHTLFQDLKDSKPCYFTNFGLSLFKSVVMLAGEFDSDSIPFDAYPGVSHLIFVMFVFLIAIVLFNLLNGLAVSDTQAIRADAELVGYISQVKLVSYIEKISIGYLTPFRYLIAKLNALCCCALEFNYDSTQFRCFRILSKKVNLFSDISLDYVIRVFPNQENRVEEVEPALRRKDRPLWRRFHKRESQEFLQISEVVLNEYTQAASSRNRRPMATMEPTIVRAAQLILSQRAEDEIRRLESKSGGKMEKLFVEFGERLDRLLYQVESSSEKTQAMVQKPLDITTPKKGSLEEIYPT